ncbi:MAG: hypothetical protein SFV53_07220, partial [Rickettsiales bacterium]|nr:hypothetical protein [Rickettsiales bacterium]
MKLEKVANTVFKIKIKSQEIDGLVIPDNQDKPGASNPNYQTPNKRDSTNLKKTSTEKPSVKSETREEFESFKRKLYRKITILESFATISEERQKNAKNPNNKTEDDDSLKPDQNSDKTVVKKIELKEEEKKEIDDFFSEKEKSKINDNIEKINNLTFGVLEEIRNKPKEANKPREANKGEELKKKIKEKFESLGVSYTDDYTFDEELKLDFIDLDKIKGYLKNKLYSQLVENFKKNFPSKDDTKILLYLFEKKKEEGKKDGFYSKVFEAYLRDIEKRAKTKNGREGVKHIIPELIEHLIHHTEEATPEEIAELARKEYGSKTELWYVANRLESDAFEDEKYLRQFLKKLKKDPETPFDPNKGKGKIDKDKIKKREPAEIIQRAYKDYLERKKKKEEEEKKKKKIESATKIQALYRGYKVRKLIKLKNSSDPDSDPDSDSDSDLNPDSDPDLGSGSGSGSDFNPNSDLDKTLKKLQEIIKNLQGLDKTAIDELLKKIESLNKQIVNLDSSKIDDLKKELEDFKQNLQNLATKLDLDDAKKELENSIASLGNSIAQLQDQINNLNINNSSITSNNYFSANDLQSFYKKRGLDDILIPSVLGDGRDNAIEIKKYGLPIFAYDGLATNNLFEYNLKEAFDAWEKEGNHNADSRYTSLGGQQQKTLVSIARLTNRTLPGAVDCYAVNTVTARGVTKSFISETEFAAEIEAPLQDFYDAQLKFLENQITNGKIPTFEESFTLANLAPSKNLEDRLFQAEILDQIKERRDQKRKANVEKLEAKIDEGF